MALCPLIFGYVNYSVPVSGKPVHFHNAPRRHAGGRPGSTLGGTGIGVSRRCDVTEPLRRHLLWLLGEDAQSGFIPNHDGQPSRRSAWADDGVNRASSDFYRNPADTLEQAYVRPRHDGYIRFQTAASALLRDAFRAKAAAAPTLAELQKLYETNRKPGGER